MAYETVKLLGWMPDVDPTTLGILTNSAQVIPTDRGIASGVGVTLKSAGLFLSNSLGCATVIKTDGTQRWFAGDNTELWEVSGYTLTNRSGSTYAATTTDTWSFAQFGDITLAINKQNNLQQVGAVADFATVSGAPKASIVVTPSMPTSQFAMCFDYDDGTNNYTDGIFWSALGDYTNWTPSLASQSGNIRIVDSGGPFTAAIPYRSGVIAFKARSMYLGTYVGGAAVWSWERISADVGCIGKNAVVEAEDLLYFADTAGFWVYDGSYPRRIVNAPNNFWATAVAGFAKTVTNFIRATWDKAGHRIWFSYNASQGGAQQYIVYNTRSGLWTHHGGIGDGSLNLVSELIDSAYALGVHNGSPTLFQVSGSPPIQTEAWLHVIGDAGVMTQFDGLRPHWLSGGADTNTTWAQLAVQTGSMIWEVVADNTSPNLTNVEANGIFHNMLTDRYLRPKVLVPSGTNWEFGSYSIDLRPAGDY